MVDIVGRACRSSVIHEVPRIESCLKVFDDKGQFTVSPIIPLYQMVSDEISTTSSPKDPISSACTPWQTNWSISIA